MPITAPSFTASQLLGRPEDIVFEDTSTGSDVAVVERRIFLLKNDGTYLVPSGTTTSYIVWPIASDPYAVVDVLDKDMALTITVQWLNVSNTALYTHTILTVFTLYNEQFDYSLTSLESSFPDSYLQGNNWYFYRMKLRVEIDNAIQAISEASSIGNAQACCDRATYIRENQSLLY